MQFGLAVDVWFLCLFIVTHILYVFISLYAHFVSYKLVENDYYGS